MLSGVLLGGLLGLVASAQPWWRATGEGAEVPFTGGDSTAGLSQALMVVALAGLLLVLSLRTRGTQVLAVLLALTGAGALLTAALRLRPSSGAVRSRLREVSLVERYALTATAWPLVYAAAGALVAAAAVGMLIGAPRWPRRPDRFERAGGDAPLAVDDSDPAALWKAMDAGVDPTVAATTDHDPRPRPRPGLVDDVDGDGSDVAERPDVHLRAARDRMGREKHSNGPPHSE